MCLSGLFLSIKSTILSWSFPYLHPSLIFCLSYLKSPRVFFSYIFLQTPLFTHRSKNRNLLYDTELTTKHREFSNTTHSTSLQLRSFWWDRTHVRFSSSMKCFENVDWSSFVVTLGLNPITVILTLPYLHRLSLRFSSYLSLIVGHSYLLFFLTLHPSLRCYKINK